MLEPDGAIRVYVGSSAIGQGLETAFAQIAADALEVPIERIRGVLHGTTSYVSDGYGAYHSRSVVMGGSAILAAAKNLREAIRTQAAERLGCEPAEVEILEGSKAVGAGRQVDRASKELASERISAEGAFLNKKHTYTYGAHAAHVAVDPKLGHVRAYRLRDRRGLRAHHQPAHGARPGDRLGRCKASAAPSWSTSSTTIRASC